MVAVGAYSRGRGFLTICSSRVGAYSRGGQIRGFMEISSLHSIC